MLKFMVTAAVLGALIVPSEAQWERGAKCEGSYQMGMRHVATFPVYPPNKSAIQMAANIETNYRLCVQQRAADAPRRAQEAREAQQRKAQIAEEKQRVQSENQKQQRDLQIKRESAQIALDKRAAEAQQKANEEESFRQKALEDRAEEAQQKANEENRIRREKHNKFVAEQIQREKEEGFKRITFNDFLLDGEDLAANNTRISISGYYKRRGDIETLYPSDISAYNESDRAVGILTKEAPRTLREYFLQCAQDGRRNYFGCPIVVSGYVTMCTKTFITVTKNMPCLVVTKGWNAS